jgi:tetratricopeptide (TPR) repeat protein
MEARGRPFPIRSWLGAGALVALLVAVYSPALQGDFIWDDDVYISENRLLREPGSLWRIWFTTGFESQYFPLTITVFHAGYQLWGLNTLGYHLVNVAVHALNSLLVWRLLAHLGVVGAGVAAAIFALHPVQVETVAWMTELKNVLSTTFYLLAVGAYVRFDDGSRLRWYLLAFALFVLGLLSKTVVCTLPGALLVLRWWRRKPIGLSEIALLLPFFVVGVGMGLFVAWYETSHIGTIGPEFQLSVADRFLIAGRALWFYLGKLAFPTSLAFSYPRWQLDPADPRQWAWLVNAILVALVLWLGRERLGRAPAAGLAFFAVTLSPMLGFVDYYTMRYSFVADHYQYVACLGPIALVAAAGSALVVRHGRSVRPARRVAGLVIAGLVLAALAGLSWRHAGSYRDRETLWRATIANNAGSWMAHNNLGNVLVDQGHLDEALNHYETARRLNPVYSDPYSNIAGVYTRRGRFEEAIELFQHAIALEPGAADFHYNLGIALTKAGRNDEAIATFEHALELVPTHPEAHNNLANLLAERGEHDEALAHYRAAARQAPEDPAYRENAADTLAALGDQRGAVAEYRAALRLAPEEPTVHIGLAGALAALGDTTGAIAHYEKALALSPDAPEAHYNLGLQLAAAGRLEEAAAHYREALLLTPDDADAANNLGATLMALGRAEEAIGYFEQAVQRMPDDVDVRANLAMALHRTGRIGAAIDVLRDALAQLPDDARLANLLAWLRATTPSAHWRDGAEAVQLAERACTLTNYQDPNYVDTLAAAYAEAGRFADAVRTAQRALKLAGESPQLTAQLKRRLALYEGRQPYRER